MGKIIRDSLIHESEGVLDTSVVGKVIRVQLQNGAEVILRQVNKSGTAGTIDIRNFPGLGIREIKFFLK